MRRVFELEDLECAHCAQKVQDAVSKIEGVSECNVAFLTAKLTYEVADDMDEKVEELVIKTVANILPDVTVNALE